MQKHGHFLKGIIGKWKVYITDVLTCAYIPVVVKNDAIFLIYLFFISEAKLQTEKEPQRVAVA